MTRTNHDAASLLIEAADIIADRALLRDQPTGERSMARTVAAFAALTDLQLTELQGWQFMICLKLARTVAGAPHLDDYTDAAAYAALAGECMAATQQLHDDVAAELTAAADALHQLPDATMAALPRRPPFRNPTSTPFDHLRRDAGSQLPNRTA